METKDILIRCSSLDELMPTPKQRTLPFNDTQINKLIQVYAEQVEGRKEDINNKFLEKGNEREEDSITLLSRLTKTVYKKNKERLKNSHITGLPDIYTGESIINSKSIIDIKTSWSRITFLKAKYFNWAENYKWQVSGYMGLSGAKSAKLAFCLVNGTAKQIMAEKNKLKWDSKFMDVDQDPIYKDKCRQVEINHIFDIQHFVNENPGFDFDNDISNWFWDIPMEKRLYTFEYKRDENAIKAIYERVDECKQFIKENL